MVENRLGIELDGVRATLVEVTGHSAVTSRTVVGKTPADALTKALEGVKPGKKAPSIRVSLVSSNAAVRRIDVTSKALTDRAAFEKIVKDTIPNSAENTSAAGLFFNAEELVGDNIGAGIAAVAPAEEVEDAYRALSAFPDAEVVPPAFTLVGLDGFHLAVRYSNADLTLVVNGNPVANRQLPVKGLATVAEALAPGALGFERLEATLNNTGTPDPIAFNALDAYLRELVSQVVKTRTAWLAQGLTVPSDLFVLGVGAHIYDLINHLEDVGLNKTTNEELVRKLVYIPLAEREAATGAFLAGATYGEGHAAAYPSPVALERALAARKRAQSGKRVLIGLLALTIPAVAYFGPISAGTLAINSAKDERSVSESRFQAVSKANVELSKVRGLEGAYSELASNDPRWNAVLSQAFGTANTAGASINSIITAYEDGGIVVTASAEAYDPGATYTPLTNWLNLLQDPEGDIRAVDVSTASFSHAELTSTSSFQVRFLVPVDLVTEKRSLTEGE